jgi:hypothetical protein
MERLHLADRLHDILSSRRGFVYNDFASGTRPGRPPSKSARSNVLHGAQCGYLQVSLSVAKYYAGTLEDAMNWLGSNRGEEGPAWHRCGCVAGAQPGAPAAANAAQADTPGVLSAEDPFAEREVERLLYLHLERQGYEVERRVHVPSGIIDAVATGQGERVVIEAKGEDRGGYTSAQMNFQIGVGQMASRMADESSVYAVAFPDTPDYRRVLKTFRGSVAFRLLNLRFYLVQGDGDIRAIEADEIPGWIETL